jgi:chemotaxis signal transduction protein
MAFRQRVTAPSADKLGARFLVARLHDTTIGIWAETVRSVLTPGEVQLGQDLVLLGERYVHTSLARRLGLRECSLTADSRYVLCSRGQARCVVPVDEVIGLMDIRRQDILPLSSLFTGDERLWFRGLFLFQNTMALVVNPDWLVQNVEAGQPGLSLVH